MRIRKRSGVLFTSSSSQDRVSTSISATSCIAIETGHKNGAGEDQFLLPLVAAVMDVQRAEDIAQSEGDHGTHPRPAHNWRNALQLQCSGKGDSEIQALNSEDGVGGKKVDWRWNRRVRNELDSIGLFTKAGTQGAPQDTSSSAEKEIIGGRDEEWKLSKPVLLEMGRHQKKLSVRSDKGGRGKDEIGYIEGWKDDETAKTAKRPRQENYIEQQDGLKRDVKAMPKKRNNDNSNEAEGSQCRRRNGRGWRCSQRTLVGYSLCEHHLGKGRLRSISTGIMNNKTGNCKLKELRLIDASRSSNVRQVTPDPQKPK